MKYAHYSNDGDILGFFDDAIHEKIPSPSLEISEQDWHKCVINPYHQVDIENKKLLILAPKPLNLYDLKNQAIYKVARFATEARSRLSRHADQYKLTGWHDKSQRAQRVLANSSSNIDISILQTECDNRSQGETPQALAQKQVAKWEYLATAMAVIDGKESAALKAIKSKRSANTISAVFEKFKTSVNAELNHLLGE